MNTGCLAAELIINNARNVERGRLTDKKRCPGKTPETAFLSNSAAGFTTCRKSCGYVRKYRPISIITAAGAVRLISSTGLTIAMPESTMMPPARGEAIRPRPADIIAR